MKRSFARNAIVLGLLAAVGPFAIDMYLPAFPAIAEDLNVEVGLVQMSLTSYFAAVAIFQLVYGPVSDRLGRKGPLYFGLGLYIAGAIGCALTGSVWGLIGFRFLQGIGGCAAIVVTRAVVRDLHTGAEAARLMATIMLVFSISPMLAPLAGSMLAGMAAWRAIFWVVAGIGLMGMVLTMTLLPETRPPGKRTTGRISQVGGDYLFLLKDGRFVGMVMIGALAQATFFAYLGGSSPVFQEHFGLSPTAYALMFAFNAAAFIGGAQFNSMLIRRLGAERLVATTVVLLLGLVITMFVLTLAGVAGVFVLIALLFPAFACLGFLIPTTAVLALDPHGRIAGTASALMGTMQLGFGAIAIALVSLFFDGTALPMVTAMAICVTGSFLLSLLILGRPHPQQLGEVPDAAEVAVEMPGGLNKL
jgi:DHA1 family bicyclomycin/chloramphenicol resistance-like MFS transporter